MADKAESLSLSTTEAISDVLADWSTINGGPLYMRLSISIKAAIERGELSPGTQLPPERLLAMHLAVSRKTVLSAFAVLKAEGWLSSRRGSGTWASLPPGRRWTMSSVDSLASLSGILHAAQGSLINMTTGQLEATPLLYSTFSSITEKRLDELFSNQHPMPLGLPCLINSIVSQSHAEGIPANPGNIIVTTGVQQALTLLASHYLRPGALVITEPATSLGALDALRSAGARVEAPTPGPNMTDRLLQLATDRQPSLIYLIPTHNNVTGDVISTFDKRRIVRFAEDTGTVIIEDRSHAGVRLVDDTTPPLASLSETAEIIVIDSMSKRAWTGLRVGWIIAPESEIPGLGRAKSVADMGTPQLSQYLASELLQISSRIDEERRATASQRLSVLASELSVRLPDWEWREPAGGLSLWIRLPEGDAKQYAQYALRSGVVVLPGPLLSPQHYFADRIRVSYHLPETELRRGAERLETAWNKYIEHR